MDPQKTRRRGNTTMSSDGSVTGWIGLLKQGDAAAAQQIWDVYFRRLVDLARARLRSAPRRAADEEDVALSAFDSFCRGAARGRFPRLDDRDDLWQLLVVITVRKACDLARREGRQARGSGRVQVLSDLADCGIDLGIAGEPTPELAAQVADECRRLLSLLENETLRSIALWKMEGDTNQEVAARLGCARVTIDRKVAVIRRAWTDESAP
jgi:DNA-directed RNA polymerase specialized sigma24 family protein